jgi:hypothetical protein
MTEDQYRDIAVACDRLLRADDTSLARVAIPVLHVINEHPAHLAQYAPILNPVLAGEPAPAGGPARIAARAGRGLLRSRIAPSTVLHQLRELGHVDVLIVSQATNRALTGGQDDFYFGALQRMLRERGATSAVVLASRLPVTPASEAAIWRRCLAARWQLRRLAQASPETLEGRLAELASRHALSGVTAANLRLHAGMTTVCKILTPAIVITTCEGVAAERLIWHAGRLCAPNTICVGYQHTRLLERAHAIRRALRAPGLDCDPDVILTLGQIPHDALAASPDLGATKLILYGSHRRALSLARPVSFADRARRCLVLPDADARECSILFQFAFACARLCPELVFTLRPHPMISVSTLRARHAWLREPPPNISFSMNKPLAEECAQARYCLYRGSSAVIHAVLAGVKPYYLARSREINFDPLHGLGEWRETVSSPEGFEACARLADAGPEDTAAARARSYCDRYVSRVRPEALDELLSLRSRHAGSASSPAMCAAR